MRVWTVANQKGGVGKTTTTVTLGAWLAYQGRPTLLVDLDPHGSLTAYFGLDPEGTEPSAYALFQAAASHREVPGELVRPTRLANLSLIPAAPALATLDRQLSGREGMGLVLARALRSWGDRYSHVLVDCPPMLGVLMVNALAAADLLIAPVQTEFLALKGLERMIHTLDRVNQARRAPLPCVIVPTLFDRRTRASREALEILRTRYTQRLWDGVIPVDTQLRDASRLGDPLIQANRPSPGIAAYQVLRDTLETLSLPGEG